MPAAVSCIGFAPLGLYLVLLGIVNLRTRPQLMSGGRDFAALAIGVSGLVFIGPFHLFLPSAAALRFGPYVWLLLAALYLLGCTLIVLYQKPRLVIYNLRGETLRPVLARVAETLSTPASWAGNVWLLPEWKLELVLDDYQVMRNVSLVATQDEVDSARWRQLERALAQQLAEVRVESNPRARNLLLLGLVILGLLTHALFQNPATLASDLRQFLRM